MAGTIPDQIHNYYSLIINAEGNESLSLSPIINESFAHFLSLHLRYDKRDLRVFASESQRHPSTERVS
jgi:hypothetical protein